MTHKHILANIPIVLFVFCAAFLMFTGCPNPNNTTPTQTGKVTIRIGVGDEFAKRYSGDSAARSAVPSKFEDGKGSLIFAAAVTENGNPADADLKEAVFNSSDNSLEITFDVSETNRQNYVLGIYAFASDYNAASGFAVSDALLYGSTTISIPEKSVEATITDSVVKMFPNAQNTGANGFVNLSVKIPKDYFLNCNKSGLTCERAATPDGDSIKYTVKTDSSGILANSYNVNFSILKADGDTNSTVYAWSETIHIFPGITADTWNTDTVGTVEDGGKTRVISEITIYSTFYVRGEPESGQTSWFADFGSAVASDDGDGSIGKPYSTVQKAIERIIGTGSSAGINDGETSYTIFVDGTVQNSDSNKSVVATFSSLDTNKATISIIGLGTDKATLKGRGSSCPQFDSVISIPSYVPQLDLTLRNLKITGGLTTNGGGISNAGGSKITIEDCEISGNRANNGGGIYNASGTVTLTNCTITGNTADNNGGGIYNDGTITLKDCTIENNTASKGVGMHNSGTMMVSGAVKFAATDDIYLDGSSYITIAGTLSESTVARITTAVSLNKQILGVDGTNVTKMTYNICKRFLLSNENETEPLGDYIVYPDSTEKQGVIAHPDANVPIKLPVSEYTFKLLKNGKELKTNSASTDDELTFKVYDSANSEVTDAAKYKIAFKQNGEEIANLKAESTNANTAKVIIPQKLVDTGGLVDVVVSATINGVTYDKSVVGFRMTKKPEVDVSELETYLTNEKWNGKTPAIIVDAKTSSDYNAIKNALNNDSVKANITGVDLEFAEGVTFIDYSALSDCNLLTSLTIPGSVTYIGYNAFRGCNSLTSVTFLDGAKTTGSGAFSGCKALTSVELPDSIETIGDSTFSGCSSLSSIKIPDSVTSIDSYAFRSCSSLASIEIPDSVTSIGEYAFSWCSSLASIKIPDSVTSIGDSTFSSCSSLASIKIPDSVTSIGNSAFNSCSSLASIEIPDNVTSIGDSAFYSCTSLTSIEIPENVISIGDYAFNGCSLLASVEIPESVTSIGECAFSHCNSLASINVDENNANYCSDDGVLFNEEKTLLICYPAGKEGTYTIPSSVISIGKYAFYGCVSNPTSVIIPSNVKTISDYAFYGCSSLASVVISEGVTSINYLAFASCSSLTSITIPSSVTTIGKSAFANSSSLISVKFNDTSNWYVDSSETPSYTTAIDVTNENKNADNFKIEYGSWFSRYLHKKPVTP